MAFVDSTQPGNLRHEAETPSHSRLQTIGEYPAGRGATASEWTGVTEAEEYLPLPAGFEGGVESCDQSARNRAEE